MKDFVRLEACGGIYYLRKDLIKSISHYDEQIYLGGQEPVDVKTKLNYDNTETLYFKEEVHVVVNIIMVQLERKENLMHKVEFYELATSNHRSLRRWRWKLMYNTIVIARSDNVFESKSAAKKSFIGAANGISKIDISNL